MKIPVTDTTAEAVEVACDAAWEQGRADILVELHETQAQRDQARDLAARLEDELAQVPDLIAATSEAYTPEGLVRWWRLWGRATHDGRARMEAGVLAEWSGRMGGQ